MNSRATHRGRILELLITAHGGWVSLPKIGACAARHTWYRLEINATAIPSNREAASISPDQPCTFPEFVDLAPESGYPD